MDRKKAGKQNIKRQYSTTIHCLCLAFFLLVFFTGWWDKGEPREDDTGGTVDTDVVGGGSQFILGEKGSNSERSSSLHWGTKVRGVATAGFRGHTKFTVVTVGVTVVVTQGVLASGGGGGGAALDEDGGKEEEGGGRGEG